MIYAAGNAQDIGKREEQQDYFAFSDPANQSLSVHGGFLGFVADGMGGMAYGSEAAKIAARTFLRSYEAKSPGQGILDVLKGALEQANTAVLSLVEEKGMAKGEVGTTLSAAVIHDGKLYWISVGDSRIYLYRNGKLLLLTESHTIGDGLDRQAASGQISREKALNAPDREVLTSYLGIDQLPEIDISVNPYILRQGDRVIVCSDGLFDVLPDEEIAAQMNGTLQDCCERLVSKALSKEYPHQDNVTVIAMALEDRTPITSKGGFDKVERVPSLVWIILAILAIIAAIFLASRLLKNDHWSLAPRPGTNQATGPAIKKENGRESVKQVSTDPGKQEEKNEKNEKDEKNKKNGTEKKQE